MSKFLKASLFAAYSIVIFQYIKFTLRSDDTIIELDYVTHLLNKGEKAFKNKLKKYKNNLTAMELNYKRPKRFPTDLKFVLKYTNSFLHYSTSLYKNGQQAFIVNRCKYVNCYLTSELRMLADFRDYDAVLFDVENSWDSVLSLRDPRQKYVFVASESSANYPLCDIAYNNYFNLTWTYKLDSDIRLTYVAITDKQGKFLGPKVNMTWIYPMDPTPTEVKAKLGRKKKAAAWFVSNCRAKSGRREVAQAIRKELQKYNFTIDIYGWCGTKTCPRARFDECLALLETEYYFYFAFENSFSEDYVTEKILYPLRNYAVPVVFGGSDYSRFLPPGSYIDAKLLNASQVAAEMYAAIKNKTIYEDYFRWHSYYIYEPVNRFPDVCRLCEILNEDADKRYTYKDFLQWWNPNYVHSCNHGEGRVLLKDPKNVIVNEPHHLNRDPDTIFNML